VTLTLGFAGNRQDDRQEPAGNDNPQGNTI
jgi:hypothetical protein